MALTLVRAVLSAAWRQVHTPLQSEDAHGLHHAQAARSLQPEGRSPEFIDKFTNTMSRAWWFPRQRNSRGVLAELLPTRFPKTVLPFLQRAELSVAWLPVSYTITVIRRQRGWHNDKDRSTITQPASAVSASISRKPMLPAWRFDRSVTVAGSGRSFSLHTSKYGVNFGASGTSVAWLPVPTRSRSKTPTAALRHRPVTDHTTGFGPRVSISRKPMSRASVVQPGL